MTEHQIEPPHTYSEWVCLIKILQEKSNDDIVLYALQNGTLEWQCGVAERFTEKYIGAINSRINIAVDRFQKEVKRTSSENIFVSNLLFLRKEMQFLANVANINAIPQEYRLQYVKLVQDKADEMQKSLEDSAKIDKTGRLLYIIKKNKINTFKIGE